MRMNQQVIESGGDPDYDWANDHIFVKTTSDHADGRVTKDAVRKAGILKRVTCHTFRHSGVYPALRGTTHVLGAGYDIRTVQELLGHQDVRTTMIYTHVLNRGGKGVRSPADTL